MTSRGFGTYVAAAGSGGACGLAAPGRGPIVSGETDTPKRPPERDAASGRASSV